MQRGNWVSRNDRGDVLFDINPPVFITSSIAILLFVVLGLVFLDRFESSIGAVQTWIANQTGWFFVLVVNLILGYLIYLLCSRYGRLRLGGPDAQPDFSVAAWLAMLFSAGMGIGLMFYSVAEPMYHLVETPRGAAPGSEAAIEDAIAATFLHWGLHAWGIYALMGLGLAYFSFNRGLPLSVRSVFAPVLGDRIHGWPGHIVDILASIATLFGVATSLGLGARQINAGLNHLFGVPNGEATQVALIAGITVIATISVVLGLDKGIKRLSVLNMWFAGLLLLFVMVIGPTLFVLNGMVENIGLYLNELPGLAFWTETYTQGSWQNGWTVFYWGWWIAWSPFVGMFIARISRGRTVREFLAGALIAASGMTFLWLSIFGDSAIYIELVGPGGLADAVQEDLARALFVFLEILPSAAGTGLPAFMTSAVGILATLAIVTFFVTSSDSGSLVIDIITAGGKPRPPVAQRIYWASLEGVVAAVLLLGGGLTALQTAAISAGLPFAALLLVLMFCLHRSLREDFARDARLHA